MAGVINPVEVVHRSRGVVRTDIAITTDASGDASETIVGVGFGRLVGVLYNGGLDAAATVTFKDTGTGKAIITYTTSTEDVPVMFRPTTVIATNAGVAVSAAASAPNVNRDIFLGGKISVVVAGGGNAETGTFSLIVDESNIGPEFGK